MRLGYDHFERISVRCEIARRRRVIHRHGGAAQPRVARRDRLRLGGQIRLRRLRRQRPRKIGGILGILRGVVAGQALSRCHAKSASGLRLTDFQAAATASRHVVIAAARSTR